MEDIVVIGFGGHAKSVVDSIIMNGRYHIIGYTDITERNSKFIYLGKDDILSYIYGNGVHKAVLGIGFLGNHKIRDGIVKYVKGIGFEFPSIIDKSAIIAHDVEIGEGCFIGKNVVINAASKIGKFCIVNTGAIIEHDNIIGDYSHISVGAILCGETTIGRHTMIGAGATIIQGKKIGKNCIIGANSTVLTNVEDDMKVYGIVKWGV